MKRSLVLLYALFVLLFCACAAPAYGSLAEAAESGARLGENIRIDGVDVSGLTPAEAEVLLDEAHQAALSAQSYPILADGETLEIPAASLPIAFDTEAVLLRALALPRYALASEARTFTCTPYAELEPLRAALSLHTAPLNVQPLDATASYDPTAEGRFVITEEVAGRQTDVHSLAQALQGRIQSGDTAPLEAGFLALLPAYTADQARADTQLVSKFSTSFAGSTYGVKNRVFNIKKAASLIDGAILAPGEEFDMNATLGPRNEEGGWKIATGILDGTYVQEYGGGVCQVSTTLYNAVLMADLTVIERYHHSWPLGYVAVGRDATISTGGPNFRFVNSSEVPVIISATADTKEKTITVRLYGRPLAEGVTISLKSKKTATLADLGTEYTVDRSLPPGQTEEVRKSRRGCIAVTWKEYYSAEGDFIRKVQVSEDKYRSIKGLIKVSGQQVSPQQNISAAP
ncbi:MAG: VanW family protein [Candidatus Pelethousia sp.]|nr:VanW family protein [Candidatus Pelethousia sp.]